MSPCTLAQSSRSGAAPRRRASATRARYAAPVAAATVAATLRSQNEVNSSSTCGGECPPSSAHLAE